MKKIVIIAAILFSAINVFGINKDSINKYNIDSEYKMLPEVVIYNDVDYDLIYEMLPMVSVYPQDTIKNKKYIKINCEMKDSIIKDTVIVNDINYYDDSNDFYYSDVFGNFNDPWLYSFNGWYNPYFFNWYIPFYGLNHRRYQHWNNQKHNDFDFNHQKYTYGHRTSSITDGRKRILPIDELNRVEHPMPYVRPRTRPNYNDRVINFNNSKGNIDNKMMRPNEPKMRQQENRNSTYNAPRERRNMPMQNRLPEQRSSQQVRPPMRNDIQRSTINSGPQQMRSNQSIQRSPMNQGSSAVHSNGRGR